MSYSRVIPRDLFNEAKLLKCLGQLSLLLHEGRGVRWPLRLEYDDQPFAIGLDAERHGLYCENLLLYCNDYGIGLYARYNSKEPYPLCFFDDGEGAEGEVFNADGTFAAEFQEYLDRISNGSSKT